MDISEFTPGTTYRMTIVPYLDCEPGEERVKVLKVLSPVTAENSRMDDGESVEVPPPQVLAEWKKFLRVQDEHGDVRLQTPTLAAERAGLKMWVAG